jgi:hypothetical protein
MEGPFEIHMGENWLQVQADLVVLIAKGDHTEEMARRLVEVAHQVRAQHGGMYVLVDLREAGSISPPARRVMATFGAEYPPLAIAMFGATPLVRGMNALLFGAMNMLGKQRQNMRQFASEAEAQSWLADERRRRLATSSSGSQRPPPG